MPPESTAGSLLLQVRDASVFLGHGRARREVLKGVDFQVRPGESVGLIGETGSGKTTLARTVLGLNPLVRGSVTVDGIDIGHLTRSHLRKFRRSGAVQYVFQDPFHSLDPEATVGAAVAEGLLIQGRLTGIAVREKVRAALTTVNLDPSFADRLPGELSGGQRQRVAIARAIAVEPRLLICDEPVSALDAANRVQILELLKELRANLGTGLIYISHDLASVASVTESVSVLYHGEVLESGTTSQVLSEPQHSYTKLLVASVPGFGQLSEDHGTRQALRDAVHEDEPADEASMPIL